MFSLKSHDELNVAPRIGITRPLIWGYLVEMTCAKAHPIALAVGSVVPYGENESIWLEGETNADPVCSAVTDSIVDGVDHHGVDGWHEFVRDMCERAVD